MSLPHFNFCVSLVQVGESRTVLTVLILQDFYDELHLLVQDGISVRINGEEHYFLVCFNPTHDLKMVYMECGLSGQSSHWP